MNWDALRIGQRLAITTAVARFRAGEDYTSIVLPTRYGKSDVMRVLTILLWQDGYTPCALALSPNSTLRDQLGSQKKWVEAITRYGIEAKNIKIRTLDGPELRPNANSEMFLSATIQLVERNLDLFRQWVQSMIHQTGKPPLLLVDESHTGSEDNSWGDTVRELVVAGARVVLLTATAIRSDGKRIPGFDFAVDEEEPVRVTMTKPGSTPELVRVEIYGGTKRLLRLIADHETPFKDAWDQNALCKIGRVPFDVDMSRVEAGKPVQSGLLLSSIEHATDIRRALSRAVRSKVVIHEGVQRLVKELRRYKTSAPDAAAIVFCGNDNDKDDPALNKHAHQIRAEINRCDPDLKVLIATSADLGKERLEAFAAGVGDVLIVKQMASLGLDIGRLKVGLDLSPVRTVAGTVQRMMRIATIWKHIITCVWITVDDLLFRGIFQDLVEASGGAAKSTDLELIRWYEKERSEEEPPSFFGIDGTDLAPFEDSDANRAGKEKLPIVETLLDAFPLLTSMYSHAYLATRADEFGLVPADAQNNSEPPAVRDTRVETEVLWADINETADDIAKTRLTLGRYSPEEFVELRRDAFIRAYQFAGIPRGMRLREITDIRALKMVQQELLRIRAELSREVSEER